MALDDKVKKGARNCAIGIGMIVLGHNFDYGAVDDIVNLAGWITAGWNAMYGMQYVKHMYNKRLKK